MKDYSTAVYIGRFQPFHHGHLAVVKKGLEIAEKLIIVVGSVNAAPSIKNPWSFEERKEMIVESIAREVTCGYSTRIEVVGVRDYHYNENAWVAEVQSKTDSFIRPGETVVILGEWKDASSYYLKHFPQWEFVSTVPPDLARGVEATAIRERLLRESFLPDWEGKLPEARTQHMNSIVRSLPVPDSTKKFLYSWVQSAEFMKLTAEFKFITEYKGAWANAPYPPTFVTVDACVVCSGHVLVVRRKINPGKGLLALPGGFLRESEKTQAGALRELREETGIRVDPLILESSVVGSKVFDYPGRSLRGRTISHGFYIKLRDGKLPEVSGGDDAAEAFWMPLADVSKFEREFFDDHAHIINYFVSVGGWI